MATSTPVGFYSLSRDGDSGTTRGSCLASTTPPGFYSLSRDGDSGTLSSLASSSARCFYSLSRDGDSGTTFVVLGVLLLAAGFYSLSRDGDSGTRRERLTGTWARVSIRCREMGTAEHVGNVRPDLKDEFRCPFLFAVARWGQRNHQAIRPHPCDG